MKTQVHFFKPSGKWYDAIEIDIPDNAMPWDLRNYLPKDRYTDMHAVVIEGAPWRHPVMTPAHLRNPCVKCGFFAGDAVEMKSLYTGKIVKGKVRTFQNCHAVEWQGDHASFVTLLPNPHVTKTDG